MIAGEDAWKLLAARLDPLAPNTVARRDAGGRVLATTLTATLDVPAHDVSAMDGFAVAADATLGTPIPVVATIAAGDPPGFTLARGQAAAIMTGAPTPTDTDRIIPVELTERQGQEVIFNQDTRPGAHIRRRAEVIAKGATLLTAGTLLTPGGLGLLATHGYRELAVYRAPRVAVLATGDEVVAPHQTPAAGQLRDSHTDFLLAAGRSLGLEFDSLGIAPDDRAALHGSIQRGMEADVLIVCGGVSMGEFDLVEDVLVDLGCEVLFDKVAVQPGKPTVAARHPGGLVFGLPGNPASVIVTFWLFVRPVLRLLQGLADGYWHGALRGELRTPLPGAKARDRFLPAIAAFEDGRILVSPYPPVGSHDVAAYARGTVLVKVPAGAEPQPAGAVCEVLPLIDWPGEPLSGARPGDPP